MGPGGFDFGRGYTLGMFIISLLSILATCAAIFALTSQESLVHKHTSITLLHLFTSQLLTSIGSTVGEPQDHSSACWFMGIVTNVFTLSSMLWSIVLSSMLLRAIYDIHKDFNLTVAAVLCYGIPIFVTFIPLINTTYAAPDGQGWCWVSTTPHSPSWANSVWFWVSFYAWVWLSFAINLTILAAVIVKYLRMRLMRSVNHRILKEMIMSLTGYPIAILIAWLPPTVDGNPHFS